ncbi:TPA: hypothetical protein ACOB1Z_001208 [Neisseria gonorrhoeae]
MDKGTVLSDGISFLNIVGLLRIPAEQLPLCRLKPVSVAFQIDIQTQ